MTSLLARIKLPVCRSTYPNRLVEPQQASKPKLGVLVSTSNAGCSPPPRRCCIRSTEILQFPFFTLLWAQGLLRRGIGPPCPGIWPWHQWLAARSTKIRSSPLQGGVVPGSKSHQTSQKPPEPATLPPTEEALVALPLRALSIAPTLVGSSGFPCIHTKAPSCILTASCIFRRVEKLPESNWTMTCSLTPQRNWRRAPSLASLRYYHRPLPS